MNDEFGLLLICDLGATIFDIVAVIIISKITQEILCC